MRDQQKPTGSAGASGRMLRVVRAVPLLGALLGGCGAGNPDDAALPLAQGAPAIAATPAYPLPAQVAPAPMPATDAVTTLPTPAAAAVGADAGKEAVRTTAKDAAPAGRHAPAPTRSPSIALALDADVAHPIVIECVDRSGAVTAVPQPSIRPCPAGDALPPASSPWFVSAGAVVDPTAGRHAGDLPRSR